MLKALYTVIYLYCVFKALFVLYKEYRHGANIGLIIFISIPLIEIALFIQVGGFIGLWPTIAIVIITAILGTFLIRKQGLSTLQRAQNELEKKQIPIRELFEGICLIFSVSFSPTEIPIQTPIPIVPRIP